MSVKMFGEMMSVLTRKMELRGTESSRIAIQQNRIVQGFLRRLFIQFNRPPLAILGAG